MIALSGQPPPPKAEVRFRQQLTMGAANPNGSSQKQTSPLRRRPAAHGRTRAYANAVYLAGQRRMQLVCGHAEAYETAQPNNQAFEAESFPISSGRSGALARWKSKRPTRKYWMPATQKVSLGAACSPIQPAAC
jgi:hypothetical protein